MTTESQAVEAQDPKQEEIQNNLAKQRKMYEKQLEQERVARQQAEQRIAALEAATQEKSTKSAEYGDDDRDDEPYVDHKKLHRELNRFQKNIEQTIDQKAEAKAAALLEQERRTNYLRENADFNNIMNEETIERFATKHPRLAENILKMPDGFERQKLVYENIKALGLDKPQAKEPSIQEKIDANRRSPYYQPSSVGASPYSGGGDFSPSGQKAAHAKMQELKQRLRI